jgi:hypothetical protein
MKYLNSNKDNKKNGKLFFVLTVVLLVLLFAVSIFISPPKFKECKNEISAQCACPEDEKYIGNRNIIFIDATDEVVAGKFQDLERIIKEISFGESNFINWISSGKKIEKTSIYLLADKKPVDMQPIASYCSFPPDATLLITDLSEDREKKIKNASINDIQNALKKIRYENTSTNSYIVEGLSVATSNAASWVAGSKLVIVSDLYENSVTCGQFETGRISDYVNVSKECNRWVDILGENLTRVSSSSINKKSSVSICQVLSKKQSDGLISFWRELFQSQLDYDVKFTCDPHQIQERHNFLNK